MKITRPETKQNEAKQEDDERREYKVGCPACGKLLPLKWPSRSDGNNERRRRVLQYKMAAEEYEKSRLCKECRSLTDEPKPTSIQITTDR
ncbi:MAG: phage terminase large subunit family protein [Halobacteriota archaeon]